MAFVSLFQDHPPGEETEFDWTNNFAGEKLSAMKALAFCGAMLFLVGHASGQPQQSPPGNPALYGAYPANYKEIVMNWLNQQLVDAPSARIDWTSEPKPVDLGKNGQHVYGYLVTFEVNARNRFGGYTGKQKHGALIKDGQVIKGLGLGY